MRPGLGLCLLFSIQCLWVLSKYLWNELMNELYFLGWSKMARIAIGPQTGREPKQSLWNQALGHHLSWHAPLSWAFSPQYALMLKAYCASDLCLVLKDGETSDKSPLEECVLVFLSVPRYLCVCICLCRYIWEGVCLRVCITECVWVFCVCFCVHASDCVWCLWVSGCVGVCICLCVCVSGCLGIVQKNSWGPSFVASVLMLSFEAGPFDIPKDSVEDSYICWVIRMLDISPFSHRERKFQTGWLTLHSFRRS